MNRLCALVLGIAACADPPKRLVEPGQVTVVGDSTFTTGDHNTIVVTTRRTLDDASATGSVTLHDLDLDGAKRSVLLRIAAGRAWLAIAHQLADPQRAYDAAKRGVDELGSMLEVTHKRHIIDDTQMHVHIAEDNAAHGDYQAATE